MVWDKLQSLDKKNLNTQGKTRSGGESEQKPSENFCYNGLSKSWDMSNNSTYNSWKKSGAVLKDKADKAGAFTISIRNKILEHIYPAGVFTSLKHKENGTFLLQGLNLMKETSGFVSLETKELHFDIQCGIIPKGYCLPKSSLNPLP